MSNMSYCMFENTSLDMNQLLNAMKEIDCLRQLDLSKTEKQSFESLKNQCYDFIRMAEDLEAANSEIDEEFDDLECEEDLED